MWLDNTFISQIAWLGFDDIFNKWVGMGFDKIFYKWGELGLDSTLMNRLEWG